MNDPILCRGGVGLRGGRADSHVGRGHHRGYNRDDGRTGWNPKDVIPVTSNELAVVKQPELTDSDSESDEEPGSTTDNGMSGMSQAVVCIKPQTHQCEACRCKSYDEMEMAAHRRTKHEFCKPCDRAFADYRGWTYHLCYSGKHIACDICTVEFKSKAGLDTHTKQFHKGTKEFKCPGCFKPFMQKSAVVQHIEVNQCEGISELDLIAVVAHLANPIPYSTVTHPEVIDGLDEILKVQPAQTLITTKKITSGFERKDARIMRDGIMTKVDDPKGLVPAATRSMVYFELEEKHRVVDREKVTLQECHKQWDPVQGAFICPNRRCRKKFRDPKTGAMSLQQHIASPTHNPENYTCHHCGAYFKSPSCVIQHIESGQCSEVIRMGTYNFPVHTEEENRTKLEELARKDAESTRGLGWAVPPDMRNDVEREANQPVKNGWAKARHPARTAPKTSRTGPKAPHNASNSSYPVYTNRGSPSLFSGTNSHLGNENDEEDLSMAVAKLDLELLKKHREENKESERKAFKKWQWDQMYKGQQQSYHEEEESDESGIDES